MRTRFFSISYFLILIASLIKCANKSFPFLKGNYMYWIVALTVVAFVFVLKNKTKTLKINTYDGVLILLAVMGTLHFVLFSRATIYNTTIWNYMGYLSLYVVLRNYCTTTDITKKAVWLLLYFCTITAVINLIWMFLQWKHLVSSPNEFFLTTGLFFSPNQLGIYLSIGCICSLFLWQKATILWQKIGLGISFLLIFAGLCITESRGAFISLCVAMGYYFYSPPQPSPKWRELEIKAILNWKIAFGIVVFLVSSFYFITTVNKNKSESTSGRYFTTQHVLKQIAENPLGYGVNSFSLEYNKAKAQYFEKNSNWEEMQNAGYVYNANNDFLELTFELGVLWIVIFIVFIMLLFKKKNTAIETQIARTILFCLIVFSLTNNILILPVFAIIACICTVVIINTRHSKVICEFENKAIYKVIVLGSIVFFLLLFIARVNAEHKLYRLYEGKIYLKGENQLQGYVSKIDNKGEELFMGGMILVKNGYKKEGIEYMQTGFERSGKPTLGRILAQGLQKQKKYAPAEAIYSYNKNVEPYRYEARMDLFDLFVKTNQTIKAKKMALEIIDLPVKIPSQKITTFKRKAQQFLYCQKIKKNTK